MNNNSDNKNTSGVFSKTFDDDSFHIPILFYYCSVETFYSIIQNKEIWLTDPKFMNDYMEQHYLDRAVYEIVNLILQENLYKKEIVQEFWNYYNIYASSSNCYYCCFSSNGDLLSQWCRYADDGRGFSIGFRAKSWNLNSGVPVQMDAIPSPNNQLMLDKIIYYSDSVKEFIKKLVNSILDLLKNDNPNISSHGSILSGRLCSLRNIIKNPAFSEEKEFRIIFNDPSEYVMLDNFGFSHDRFRISPFLENYKFRRKNNSISRYYPLKFSASNFIDQVFIGPKNISLEKDICDFLKANIITDVKIQRSSASYR